MQRTGRRRGGVVLALLLAIEGLATLADHAWSFRPRLLSAFETAARREPDEEHFWADPKRLFEPDYSAFNQVLRFRIPGSRNPIGEEIAPASLPPGKRVFVIGESAAFGVGSRSEETFAALLDDRLQARGVRVLNAGQVGADAWQVLDAGAQLLTRYAPSVLVIFTGNNLWIDWMPPQQARGNPWGLRVLSTLATSRAIAGVEYVALRWTLLHTPRRWRVEQLSNLDRFFLRVPLFFGRTTSDSFHDHHEIAGSSYTLAHPLEATAQFGPADWRAVHDRYLGRFEMSLETLAQQAHDRGVRVVFVTLPFNYRLSPAWKHPQFEALDPEHHDAVRTLLRDAGQLVEAGEYQAALPLTEQALALDPGPPLLHYLRAQCLEQLGRLDEAEAAYAQSRERMIGNLGSRLSVNAVIRRVAARLNIAVVDAAQLFDASEHANGHHFNETLILDDCHLSPAGHRLLADALTPALM